MNDAALTELRELRARAYGPGADIAGDAVARARLRELEEQVRLGAAASAPLSASLPPARDDDSAPHDGVPATAAPATADEAAPLDFDALLARADDAESREAPEPPSGWLARLRPTRPVAVAWMGSVVAVAVLVGALTSVLGRTGPSALPDGARQVATIGDGQRGDDDLAKTWFGTTGDARSYTFLGLTVLTTDQGWDEVQQACVVVVPTDGVNWQDRAVTGQLYSGCSVGAFPATAEFTVHQLSPSELRAAYPIGTSLQFILGGDEVSVFADDGRAGQSADGN